MSTSRQFQYLPKESDGWLTEQFALEFRQVELDKPCFFAAIEFPVFCIFESGKPISCLRLERGTQSDHQQAQIHPRCEFALLDTTLESVFEFAHR